MLTELKMNICDLGAKTEKILSLFLARISANKMLTKTRGKRSEFAIWARKKIVTISGQSLN